MKKKKSYLAVVGGREVAAEAIELSLNLLLGGVVGDVGLGDLDDELADSARGLLDGALLLLGGLRRAELELGANGLGVLVVLEPRDNLRKIVGNEAHAL